MNIKSQIHFSIILQLFTLSILNADIGSDITDCNQKLNDAQTCFQKVCDTNNSLVSIEKKPSSTQLKNVIENIEDLIKNIPTCEEEVAALKTSCEKVTTDASTDINKAKNALKNAKDGAQGTANDAKKEKSKFDKDLDNVKKAFTDNSATKGTEKTINTSKKVANDIGSTAKKVFNPTRWHW